MCDKRGNKPHWSRLLGSARRDYLAHRAAASDRAWNTIKEHQAWVSAREALHDPHRSELSQNCSRGFTLVERWSPWSCYPSACSASPRLHVDRLALGAHCADAHVGRHARFRYRRSHPRKPHRYASSTTPSRPAPIPTHLQARRRRHLLRRRPRASRQGRMARRDRGRAARRHAARSTCDDADVPATYTITVSGVEPATPCTYIMTIQV